ncbi:hypothetical protein JW890_04970 [candidate division WOR-3 bacterium]|nr:hypothetical protein [candidate division WOR-3 bacterium]
MKHSLDLSDKIELFGPLEWYIKVLIPFYSDSASQFRKKEKTVLYEKTPEYQTDVGLFLKNTLEPFLTPGDPFRKKLENATLHISPSFSPFDMDNLYSLLKNMINPSARTLKTYPSKEKIFSALFSEFECSSKPDLTVFFDRICRKEKMGRLQTIMLKKNRYSLDEILIKGEIVLKKLADLKSDPTLALKALESVSKCVEKIGLPYNMKRFPVRYDNHLEIIVESMGFPPLASLKLKSEMLSGYYLISWTA